MTTVRYHHQEDAYPHNEFYFELVQYHKYVWYVRFVQRDGTQIDVPPGVAMYDRKQEQSQPRDKVLFYCAFERYDLYYNGRPIVRLEPVNESRVILANPLNTESVVVNQ